MGKMLMKQQQMGIFGGLNGKNKGFRIYYPLDLSEKSCADRQLLTPLAPV
jgi:hypothetical protein